MKTIYLRKPYSFNPKFNVVGGLIQSDDKFLCLLRRSGVCEENKWGFVAGKVKESEKQEEALIREIYEETHLTIDNLKFEKTFYVRYPEFDFEIHMYSIAYPKKPEICIDREENQEYRWVDVDEFDTLPIVNGNKEIISELILKGIK